MVQHQGGTHSFGFKLVQKVGRKQKTIYLRFQDGFDGKSQQLKSIAGSSASVVVTLKDLIYQLQPGGSVANNQSYLILMISIST